MILIDLMQAQIDGNIVQANFTIPARITPPKAVAASRRDASRNDNLTVDAEKDGPKRQRECKFISLLLNLEKSKWAFT